METKYVCFGFSAKLYLQIFMKLVFIDGMVALKVKGSNPATASSLVATLKARYGQISRQSEYEQHIWPRLTTRHNVLSILRVLALDKTYLVDTPPHTEWFSVKQC